MSAPKLEVSRWKLVVGGILVLASVIFISKPDSQNTVPVKYGSKTITAEVVENNLSRQRGLSGRTNLEGDHGMLFVFEESAKHCFWMKDMNFAIDIIWIDESKTIVDVESNVAPETYPETFCSNTDAKYVLELNANQATVLGITPGATLRY